MSKTARTGFDYFPLDVVIDDDMELIEAEHGISGFAIVIKLLQKIYSNGYYIDWQEDNVLLFSKRINAEFNVINAVINSCFKRNIFNKNLFDRYKILTSSEIQDKYIIICTQLRRKQILMVKEYCLVQNPEFIELITAFIPINTEFMPQKKRKEKKGNKKEIYKEKKLESSKSNDVILEEEKEKIPPKEKEEFYPFNEFWEDYDKKVGDKIKLQSKWERVSRQNRALIKAYIPRYKAAVPDKQFRKNPEAFLNNNSWLDEIISRQPINLNKNQNGSNDVLPGFEADGQRSSTL